MFYFPQDIPSSIVHLFFSLSFFQLHLLYIPDNYDFILCSGFHGIYDVENFIRTLRYDVRIVESIPDVRKNGKTKKIKPFQVKKSDVAIKRDFLFVGNSIYTHVLFN